MHVNTTRQVIDDPRDEHRKNRRGDRYIDQPAGRQVLHQETRAAKSSVPPRLMCRGKGGRIFWPAQRTKSSFTDPGGALLRKLAPALRGGHVRGFTSRRVHAGVLGPDSPARPLNPQLNRTASGKTQTRGPEPISRGTPGCALRCCALRCCALRCCAPMLCPPISKVAVLL